MSSMISSISSQIASNIFSKIDTNNQGYISKSDLTSALGNSDSESESLFNSIDTDSDGQISKSEMSTKIENLLSQLTSSSSKGMQMPPPPGGMGGPQSGMMPPPPPGGEDTGVTQEEASEIAASTEDSKLSSIMTEISENFEAADADGDGKVTREEGMAYHQANKTNSASETTVASSSSANDLDLTKLLAQLIETYGLNIGEESSTSSVSVSA